MQHQISLPKTHSDILNDLKESMGISKSEVIRRALETLKEKRDREGAN